MALPQIFNDVNATSYQRNAWWNVNVFRQMISPDMFPSTEMEISEKWDRSSANYISENWKRNNEHLTMLSKTAKLGYLCWNRIKWCRFWDTDITVGTDVHKKENFIHFFSSKRQKRGFSVDINVQLNSRCKFWNNFFFRVSSFCTNCLRSLIISFQNANRKWSGTRFSFTLAWNKPCQNDSFDKIIKMFLDGGLKA